MLDDNQAKARHHLRIAKSYAHHHDLLLNGHIHEAIASLVEAVHAIVDSIDDLDRGQPSKEEEKE
jgi:hypothetical protein